MKGLLVQFRRGRHTLKEKHYLLDLGAKNRAEAEKFIGKEVTWKSSGKNPKVLKGKITSPHGSKGLVRSIFEIGLPGQAIATEIEVLENVSTIKKGETK